jgi:hypothetical protein
VRPPRTAHPPPDNGPHPTADTTALKPRESCGAAGDAGREAADLRDTRYGLVRRTRDHVLQTQDTVSHWEEEGKLTHGDEITSSEFQAADEASIRQLVDGEEVTVEYID